jgi:hypothetical protein
VKHAHEYDVCGLAAYVLEVAADVGVK